jgi:hypothetical protein
LNDFIGTTIATTVAQKETIAFLDDRLKGIDLEWLHQRAPDFMFKIKF